MPLAQRDNRNRQGQNTRAMDNAGQWLCLEPYTLLGSDKYF